MKNRIRLSAFFLWLFVVLSGCAHASDLKSLDGMRSDWNLLALNSKKILVSNEKQELLLLPWDNLQNALRLEGSALHLSEARFSPDESLLMLAFSPSKKSSELKIYDVLNAKVLQKSPRLERLQKAFWLNNCRYAAVVAPLENGGRLQIFKKPEESKVSSCPEFKPEQVVPSGKMPLAYWKDANFNLWAFYENGSRDLLSWLGKGSFSDLQMGPHPYFWFREQNTPDLVFRADRELKKIQPVAGASLYVADPSEARVYAVFEGALYQLSLNRKFKEEKVLLKRLPKDFRPTALWLDPVHKRLVFRSESGGYHVWNL